MEMLASVTLSVSVVTVAERVWGEDDEDRDGRSSQGGAAL